MFYLPPYLFYYILIINGHHKYYFLRQLLQNDALKMTSFSEQKKYLLSKYILQDDTIDTEQSSLHHNLTYPRQMH